MKKLLVLSAMTAALAHSAAALDTSSWILTEIYDLALPVQCCYTNGAASLLTAPDYVVSPAQRVDRHQMSTGLVYTNFFVPKGYSLDKWYLIKNGQEITAQNLPRTLDEAKVCTTLTGASVTVPRNGLSGWDTFMVLAPAFSWLKYDLWYWKNDGTDERRYDPDSGRTQTYTNEFPVMANTWKRDGYSFAGWSRSPGAAESEFAAGDSVTGEALDATTDGVNLYAVWDRIIVSVELHGNYSGAEAFSPLSVGVGDTYSLPVPTRPHHTFAGWYTEAEYGMRVEDGASVSDITITNLYAHWNVDVFTVTVGSADPRFGSVTRQGDNSVEYGGTISFGARPETGCRFDGWSDGVADAERTVVCFSNAVYWADFSIDTDSLTVHTVHSSASEAGTEGTTVYFLANGGDGEMSPQSVSAGSTFVLKANTLTGAEGREFLGWATSPAGAVEYADEAVVADSSAGPLVLYAVWSGEGGGGEIPRTCDVCFDANGGTGVTESVTLTDGTATVLPANGFRRSGYIFRGWAKSAGAAEDEADFADRASVDSVAAVAGSADAEWCVLHAVWSESSHGVAVDEALTAAACSGNISVGGSGWKVSEETKFNDELGVDVTETNGVSCVEEGAVLTAAVFGSGTLGFEYSGSTVGDPITVTITSLPDISLSVQKKDGSGNEPAWTPFTTEISAGGVTLVTWSGTEAKLKNITWSGDPAGGEEEPMSVSNAMFVVVNASYDGTPHCGVVGTVGCAVESGDAEATEPGVYSAVLRLGEGRCWPGGSTDATTNVTWTISSGEGAVANPVAYYHVRKDLSCDGTVKAGVIAVAGCEVVIGNTASDAGEYTAVLQLMDGCRWEDGTTSANRTVQWTIARGGVDMSAVTLADATFVVTNGCEYGLCVDGELPPGVTNVTYEGNGQSAAGTYQVTACFEVDEANYVPVNPVSATMRLVAFFNPASGAEPVDGGLPPGAVSCFDLEKVYDGTPLVPDVDAITNAFAPYSPSGVVQFSYTGGSAGDWSETPAGLTDAGTADVWYRVEISNADWFVHKVRLTVRPLDISAAVLTLAADSFSWTGSAIEPEMSVVFAGQTLVEGRDYTVKYSGNVSVGTAAVSVTGTGNCSGALSATFAISAVPCDTDALTLADATFIYDGKMKSLAVAGDVPEGVDVSYFYDEEPLAGVTEPGVYEVTARFSAPEGYDLSTESLRATLVIVRDASEYDGDIATVGDYCNWTLPQLGVPLTNTVSTSVKVAVKGLPSGLKLVKSSVYGTGGNKKKVVGYNYYVRGVPTAALSADTMPVYVAVTRGSKTTWHPVRFGVAAQEVADLGQDLGTWTVGAKLDGTNWLAGVGSGWTVSGLPTGLKYTPKAIYRNSSKKSLGKYPAYSVYGTMTQAGLFTVTAKKKNSAGFYLTKKYRVLVTPKDANAESFPGLGNMTFTAYVPVETWYLTNDVSSVKGFVTSVSGLPAGFSVKYAYKDAKRKTGKYVDRILGTPTKAGTSAVTFKKGTLARTVLWTVAANPEGPVLGFNTEGGVSESAKVGVRNTDLLSFAASADASVTASGLPKGVSLARLADGTWGFTGTATSAGTYLVTVKATLNGRSVSQRLALTFEGLPSWAVGTYNGISGRLSADVESVDGITSFDMIETTNGLAKVSVTSAGKISGTCRIDGTNWTLSAGAFTGFNADGAYEVTNLLAKYSWKVKSGKSYVTKSVTRRLTLQLFRSDIGDTVRGAVAARANDDCAGFAAVENLWSGAYKTIGAKAFYTSKTKKYITRTYKGTTEAGAALGLAPSESLTCKITPSGAVTLTLKKGTSSATSSATVIPSTPAEDGYEAFFGEIPFYFAPSSKFSEHAGTITVE